MKLSKQERIGVLIIAVILILGLGIWLYIVPKVQSINQSNVALDSKRQELVAAQQKAATKDDLKTQVLAAYDKGENLANMFFEEMTTYELDEEFRTFLAQCETDVYVADFAVTEPSTITLAPNYFEEAEVEYALKTYVTKDIEPTEEELATQARWEAIRNALGTSQTVGCNTVNFTFTVLSPEDMMKFYDEVNNYMKTENGKETRKALRISGMNVSYPDNESYYEELMESIAEEAEDAALDALYKEHNMKRPVDETPVVPETGAQGEEEARLNVSDTIYSYSVTLTFYTVERMQDPTPQLEAQEQ